MHQKKSEAQIIKESKVVSSGFNPTPHKPQTLFLNYLHYHNHTSNPKPHEHHQHSKGPLMTSHSPPPPSPFSPAALSLLRHFRCAHLLRLHFRLLILLSLPSLYFAISNPRRSLLLDLLSLLTFASTLLIFLNLTLPRLFPAAAKPRGAPSSQPQQSPRRPVLWSIGSKPRPERRPRASSGAWVRKYSNGDVYEGEFHKGKCSGSGVYYYHMSGRYEGDWIDEKYDGFGLETWARGSRYRGQYRKGMRHGAGVYRFYNGDVYGGEWANGQCHGSGVHTLEDGSKYVGEFKCGVKHGLGHYHFR